MDFIEGLPLSKGMQVIIVVVDPLNKAAHFLQWHTLIQLKMWPQSFMDHVFKLYGIPSTIVSDRDTIFGSCFWEELFKLQGVSLHKFTAYHFQMDGQSKVINRCLLRPIYVICVLISPILG